MDVVSSLALPAAIWVVAALILRRELRQRREQGGNPSDPFHYSKGRLARRAVGIGILALVGVTLAAWELAPPTSAGGASVYLWILCGEVAALVAVAVFDLRETARPARRRGATRRAARPR